MRRTAATSLSEEIASLKRDGAPSDRFGLCVKGWERAKRQSHGLAGKLPGCY